MVRLSNISSTSLLRLSPNPINLVKYGLHRVGFGLVGGGLSIICDLKNVDSSKIQFLDRKLPMPHNGYRAFNIDKLKKNIPELFITDIKNGIKKSINELFYL